MPIPKKKLWDRWSERGESPQAHALFIQYFELGADRSYQAVAETSNLELSTIAQLGSTFQWVRRSRAWDEYLNQVEQKALVQRRKDKAVLWAQREEEHREEAWEFANQLMARAKEMLAAPLYETIVESYQQVTVGTDTVTVPLKVVQRPVRWSFKDVHNFADLADKMKRLSLGMPTQNVGVDINWSEDPSERLRRARAAYKHWSANDLDKLVDRIMQDDPSADPEQIRAEILSQAPEWFAADWKLPDPAMIIEMDETPTALPLSLLESGDEVVN